MRRTCLWLLLVCVSLLLSLSSCSSPTVPRHLLVITLDTTRADHLGSYGLSSARTPVLDRLARQGTQFRVAITAVPVTLPSHATIWTGLFPYRHGVRNNTEFRLGPEAVTLAEVLRQQGFETAAFVSAFVLDARFGLDQGFQLYDDSVTTTQGSAFATGNNERSATTVTDAALRWLEQRPTDSRFFAWVHYFDAHTPYLAPPVYAAATSHPYDAELAYLDAQIGRLLDGLARRGVLGDTAILIVADHGEGLGDHGESSHSIFLYDSVMHVPFLLVLPGQNPQLEGRRLVSTADLFPTVLDLFGLSEDQPHQGLSLLQPAPETPRSLPIETMIPYLDYGWAPLFGWRSTEEKFIEAPRPEHYDLQRDPGETNNQFDASAAQPLRQRLEQWPQLTRTDLNSNPDDPEALERLQSLGYAGGAGPAGQEERADPKDRIQLVDWLTEANAKLSAGQFQAALEQVQKAAAVSPKDRSVLNALGKIYVRLGRLPEAETALRAMIQIQPKADPLILLAQILILDGRHTEASSLLDQAATLDPQHGGVFIARGDLLALQGRKQEALASFEHARTVDPYRAAGAAAARIRKLQANASP